MALDYTEKEFGGLYFNGILQQIQIKPIEYKYAGQQIISIGDSPVWTDSIKWIKPKGMNIWIAQRPLVNLPFYLLRSMGYLDGVQTEIDGVKYICRLVKDYSNNSQKMSEWEQLLEILGGQLNELPDWYNYPCWVESEDYLFYANTRGGAAVDTKTRYDSQMDWGFRPVLERVCVHKKTNPDAADHKHKETVVQYDDSCVIRVLFARNIYSRDADFFLVSFDQPLTDQQRKDFKSRIAEAKSDCQDSIKCVEILRIALRRFRISNGPQGKVIEIPGAHTLFV